MGKDEPTVKGKAIRPGFQKGEGGSMTFEAGISMLTCTTNIKLTQCNQAVLKGLLKLQPEGKEGLFSLVFALDLAHNHCTHCGHLDDVVMLCFAQADQVEGWLKNAVLKMQCKSTVMIRLAILPKVRCIETCSRKLYLG